jgi:3-phenylpropionate/trans-cinnamate dioxygenase ferredoxin component
MTEPAPEFRIVGDSDKLQADWVNPYYLDDLKHRVSVARVGDDQLYAFDDLYGSMPLSAGLLTGTVIMSQGDGSQWDLTDGSVVRGPATEPLRMYEVDESDGQIRVRI